jgi:NAD(P)H-dependent flavin oxidoreductase YrpB (nitropropane dioxygenase family)
MDASRQSADLPVLIQGGMGVAVSGWQLARAVGVLGQLGVVSGTALDFVHTRQLGDGDPGGDLRRAYAAFPVPAIAQRVLDRWFVDGGREPGDRHRPVPMTRVDPPAALTELTVLANFAEVWLAKEGHEGPIGINYLEKIQLPTPAAVYGAMLAGVDAVLMGAGIPTQLPRLLTDLAQGRRCAYRITVKDADPGEETTVSFDPADVLGDSVAALRRPRFLAIISSDTLASFLLKDPATAPDGFVVEGPTAGGHNAPPRGKLRLDETGQPVYGPRDEPNVANLVATGRPFWLAGGYADPEQVRAALDLGAAGVQLGTAFALCEESGLRPDLKQTIIERSLAGTLEVRTDPRASPSGFPFKVAQLDDTLSDDDVYALRERRCDVGMLRIAYRRPDGGIGYRCASEPVDTYLAKGGDPDDTIGRQCLCNGLLATTGLAQQRSDGPEPPIVTLGDDTESVVRTFAVEARAWRAADVVRRVLGDAAATR